MGGVGSLLSEVQIASFQTAGFVQVSGLIPQEIAERATAAYRRLREDDPEPANRHGAAHKSYDHPDLRACYTPQFFQALGELLGVQSDTLSHPSCPYTITIVPQTKDLPLQPHVDTMTPHSADPGFRVSAMIYLSEVFSDGGGTVVWPGSHQLNRRLLREEPESYPTLDEVQAAVKKGELPIGEPFPTTPGLGDAVFFDSRLIHSGGVNRSIRERLALNWKW